MKNRLLLCLFSSLMFVSLPALANDPGGCSPAGGVGPASPYYEYTANGVPSYDGCWYKSNVLYWTAYDACNWYRSFWQFGNGSSYIWQKMTLGSTDTVHTFRLSYTLDAIDPDNNDGTDFRSDVWDDTTGAWLGGEYWSHYNGSRTCSSRVLYPHSTSSLAGHLIRLQFTANRATTSVTMNVKAIALQYWSND